MIDDWRVLYTAIACLTDEQAEVIFGIYWGQFTQAELAEDMGVSRDRVNQISRTGPYKDAPCRYRSAGRCEGGSMILLLATVGVTIAAAELALNVYLARRDSNRRRCQSCGQ